MSDRDRKAKRRGERKARSRAPEKWMKGFSIRWQPERYVHGDGLRTASASHSYEIVPGVQDGKITRWGVIVDGQRWGWKRFDSLERAVAEAELMIMAERD